MPSPVYGTPPLDQVPLAQADVSVHSHKLTDVTDSTNPQDAATKNYVDQAISAISQNSGSGVISGCGVAWSGTGLVFDVSAGTYSINGTTYTLTAQEVTLDAADPSNPRIDLIIANTSSAADKITGTASANPVAPSVDPATQLQLTFVYVPAGATTPNVTNTLLYDENVGAAAEWNTSSSGATWALGSTNNPHTGTKDIEATSVGTNAYAQLQKGTGTVDPSTFNSLVFWIRSKATWPSNRSITISLLNAGTQYGNSVSLRDGVLGFSSSNTTGYQQIVIPLSSFNVNANPINQIRFVIAGSGGSIGFYLDTVNLQAGVTNSNQNFVVWRGTYSASIAYNKNDAVVSGNRAWIALSPNTASTPSDSNSNWQPVGDPADQRVMSANRIISASSSKVFVDKMELDGGSAITIPSTSAVLITGTGITPVVAASVPGITLNIATTSSAPVTLLSQNLTIAAFDQVNVEMQFSMFNNSAGSRQYSFLLNLGTFSTTLTLQSAFGPSSSQIAFRMLGTFGIASSSKTWMQAIIFSGALAAIGSASALSASVSSTIYNQSSSNLLGSQTLAIKVYSSVGDTTQTLDLIACKVTQTPGTGRLILT